MKLRRAQPVEVGAGAGRVGGGQYDADDLYFAPTILTEVPTDAPVMQEEIFGPILPVLEFTALDDALALLRDRPTSKLLFPPPPVSLATLKRVFRFMLGPNEFAPVSPFW
jgi:hypothetical protein